MHQSHHDKHISGVAHYSALHEVRWPYFCTLFCFNGAYAQISQHKKQFKKQTWHVVRYDISLHIPPPPKKNFHLASKFGHVDKSWMISTWVFCRTLDPPPKKKFLQRPKKKYTKITRSSSDHWSSKASFGGRWRHPKIHTGQSVCCKAGGSKFGPKAAKWSCETMDLAPLEIPQFSILFSFYFYQ